MKEKLIELIKNSKKGVYEFKYINAKNPFIKDGLTIYCKDSFGGEGKGDDYWMILSVTQDGQTTFWKIPGWYQSYEGGEYELDDMYEVSSVQKTITVWE